MYRAMMMTAAAATMGMAAPSSAATIVGLFNTGVDAAGNKLNGDNLVDTHYRVGGATTYTTSNPNYVTSSTANYIASQMNGQGGSATYTLTFSLTGLDAATAMLSGDAAYDNGVQIFLNNTLLFTDVPASPGDVSTFNSLHRFSATSSAFVAGSNTLRFVVTDYGQPTGLLVTNLTGTANALAAVPEPATWGMMLLGFGGMGFALRRRNKATTRIRFA